MSNKKSFYTHQWLEKQIGDINKIVVKILKNLYEYEIHEQTRYGAELVPEIVDVGGDDGMSRAKRGEARRKF